MFSFYRQKYHWIYAYIFVISMESVWYVEWGLLSLRARSTDIVAFQNGTYQPDHMNLLKLSEALSDVGQPCSFPYPTD